MSGIRPRDRRAERAEATRREILEAAWTLVREEGLAALSMRELGARVGMRAQSLYVYFPSKHAIFDAMFRAANEDLRERLATAGSRVTDPVAALRRRTSKFLAFCVEDPVRYQLLFQRTIPGFEPSPESYAPAVEVLDSGLRALRACGIDDPRALDGWTAIVGGLAAQQNANEPGGRRWVQLADELADMFLSHFGVKVEPTTGERGRR
jgi:AcrR family transcriptional regulator